MKQAKLALLTLLLVMSTNSMANCEPVNLYNNQSPLNEIPIVDQAEIASCYAQTTAQMVEYHLRENALSTPDVRGLWVGLVHKLKRKVHWSPNRIDYSLLEWAIKDLKSQGNCSIQDYSRSMVRVKAGNQLSDDDMVYFLNRVFKKYKKYRWSLRHRRNALSKAYDEVVSSKYFQGKITSSMRASVESMKAYSNKKFLKYLRSQVFSECKALEDVAPNIPEVVSTARGFESDEFIMQVMSNVLTADSPQPIGLGYCSKIFSGQPGELHLMKRPRLLNMVLNAGKCSAHYSVVVGQRPVGEKCEYLVRNSYGTGKWANNRSCFCEFSDGSRGTCHSDVLPLGSKVLGCWVDGKELAQNTFDLSYFVK